VAYRYSDTCKPILQLLPNLNYDLGDHKGCSCTRKVQLSDGPTYSAGCQLETSLIEQNMPPCLLINMKTYNQEQIP